MNILILAAGQGTKFDGSHFDHKALIPVNGQPMLVKAIKSLEMDKDENNNFIFLIPSDTDVVSQLEPKIREAFPTNCRVVVVHEETEGPADTAIKASDYINTDEELLIVNSHQILYWSDAQRNNIFDTLRDFEAGVVTVNSDDPSHCYVNLETGQLVEKEVVSDQALVGLYWWKKGKDFVNSTKLMMQSGLRSNGEYAMGPVYNSFTGFAGYYEIQKDLIRFIRTPEELDAYENPLTYKT
jgi:dTDP-glucose pyrophosphorylase